MLNNFIISANSFQSHHATAFQQHLHAYSSFLDTFSARTKIFHQVTAFLFVFCVYFFFVFIAWFFVMKGKKFLEGVESIFFLNARGATDAPRV